MKKLLIQLDTDPHPSAFDTVVAYDAGVDQVLPYAGITPGNVQAMVEGAIFTRGPIDKRHTAIFVGGSSMEAGEALLKAVQHHYFANFRVSVMLDSNGGNTTAAAGVARLSKGMDVRGKRAVVLAGTGPVGQRAAAMLAQDGARVALTSRHQERAQKSCDFLQEHFGIKVEGLVAADTESRSRAIADAQIVFATGAAGVELLDAGQWQEIRSIEVLADANATPPLGIAGTEMGDKGKLRAGKVCWGAIGFGTLKLKVHRACVAQLFDGEFRVFNAASIYAKARELA